jgi:phage/plasmid-associated DNA primase
VREESEEEEEEEEVPAFVFALPSDCTRAMKIRYGYLANGERGCAEYYVRYIVQGQLFTSGENNIWCYEAETGLWKQVPYPLWVQSVARLLATQYVALSEYVKKRLNEAYEYGEKDIINMWKAHNRNVQSNTTNYSSFTKSKNVAALAFTDLLNEDLFKLMDSARNVLSFRNGLLQLDTLELAPRTRECFVTYALPYDFDPDANTDDMAKLIHNLFEDEEAERACQVTLGYFITGETYEKAFWQIKAPTHSGKTTLVNIVMRAMGKYASKGEIPISEFSNSNFEGGFARVLKRLPPPRWLAWDEFGANVQFKEDVLNNATNGKQDQSISFNIKHKEAEQMPISHHAKYAFFTNHIIQIPASSTGLVSRNTGWGLRFTFVKAPEDGSVPRLHPLERFRDPELEARLLSTGSDRAVQGIMRWLVQGAQMYYQRVSLSCPRFKAASFQLQIEGDPYLAWLTTKFIPTGHEADRLTLDSFVEGFRRDARDVKANPHAYAGLKDLLDSMFSYVSPVTWQDYSGEQVGYSGIRARRARDINWVEAMARANPNPTG